jgi:alanine racemase
MQQLTFAQEAGSAFEPASLFFKEHCFVTLNKAALLHNLKLYKSILPAGTLLAPVIKGNAYGHGMLEVASILNKAPEADYLCVAKLTEAYQLIDAGITKPILVLSIIDADPERAFLEKVRLPVTSLEIATQLSHRAQNINTRALIHIKIDTGLCRMGTWWQKALQFIQECTNLPGCFTEGLFTHFANSEQEDTTFVRLQTERFQEIIEKLKLQKIQIPICHASSSAAQTFLSESHFSLTRLGIGLYGLWPSENNKSKTLQTFPHFHLKPVLEWKTYIYDLKAIDSDNSVGYNRTYWTNKKTKVAILPIGYADGYNRLLSNKGIVKINGHYAPVIGAVAMNIVTVDVSDIPDVQVGDEVLLLGNDPKINAQTMAEQCNTINYDIVTNITSNIKRKIVK